MSCLLLNKKTMDEEKEILGEELAEEEIETAEELKAQVIKNTPFRVYELGTYPIKGRT